MGINSSNLRQTPYWLQFVFNGRFFKCHHRYTIPAGQTTYMQVTPGERLWHTIAKRWNFTGNGPLITSTLEDPTFTVGNTVPTLIANLDRRSAKVPTTQLFTNPTAVSGGTLADRDILFAPGGGTGNAVRGTEQTYGNWERILKPGSDYLVAMQNDGSNTIDLAFDMFFYESDN